jgi:hypothetical protein
MKLLYRYLKEKCLFFKNGGQEGKTVLLGVGSSERE